MIGRACDGEVEAWHRLCEIYHRIMVHYFQRVGGVTAEEAEDQTQQLFADLLAGKLERFSNQPDAAALDSRPSFLNWLRRVARNQLIDHLRRLRVVQAAGGSSMNRQLHRIPQDDEIEHREQDWSQWARGSELNRVLELVASKYAAGETSLRVAKMRFSTSLTFEQIAQELSITPSTARQSLSRFMRRVREYCQENDLSPDLFE